MQKFGFPNLNARDEGSASSTVAPGRHGGRGLGFFFVVLAVLFPLPASADSPALKVWTGGPKPLFALESLDDARIALADQAGRAIFVHFFATWCEPCREELPAFRRLIERSAGRGVTLLAISVAEPPGRVQRFVAALELNFPVLLDQDRAVMKSWAVDALPTTYVLDGALKPRFFVEQSFDWDGLDVGDLLTALASGASLSDTSDIADSTQGRMTK